MLGPAVAESGLARSVGGRPGPAPSLGVTLGALLLPGPRLRRVRDPPGVLGAPVRLRLLARVAHGPKVVRR